MPDTPKTRKKKPTSAPWVYDVQSRPSLPPDATSPVMNSRQMTDWLNRRADEGWEFVGYGQTHWHAVQLPQEWWVFRQPRRGGDDA